jgi:hypothetical protein
MMESLVEKLKVTKNPAEFIGTTNSFLHLTHSSLDILIEHDLVNFYYSNVIDDKFIDKFNIPSNVPRENLNEKFQMICVDMLAVFFTNDKGVIQFNECLKKNNKIKSIIDKLYNMDDYKLSCATFTANLAIYGKDTVKILEIDYIFGNSDFNCLDCGNDAKNNEKTQEIIDKLLIKRLNGACNYYDICTTRENVLRLVQIIETKKETNNFSSTVLNYVCKLLTSFYMTLKLNDKKLKKRISALSIGDDDF